ncbi:DUF4149 domain-containing protein [Persephonella sp.]
MNKIFDFLILLLIGVLIGFNIFFTFIVAPLIFSNLEHKYAGEITNLIFPYYFGSGWILGILIYTLFAFRSIKYKEIVIEFKRFIVVLGLLIVLHMALHKTILPIGQNLNYQYYALLEENKVKEAAAVKGKFKKLHMISSSINLINLILELYLFQHYLFKIRKKGN